MKCAELHAPWAIAKQTCGWTGKIEDFGYFRGDATHPLGVIPTNSNYEGVASVASARWAPLLVCRTAPPAKYNNTTRSPTISPRLLESTRLSLAATSLHPGQRAEYLHVQWMVRIRRRRNWKRLRRLLARRSRSVSTRPARNCWIPVPSILGCMPRTPIGSATISPSITEYAGM